MKIKSIYKNKGDQTDMKNQKGLFLTSTVAKTFEKRIYEKNKIKVREGVFEFQCGGMENRSTIDNLLILQGTIDYHRYIGQNLHILSVDAEKCFDKLWLDDVCNEMYALGITAAEVDILHKMNSDNIAYVDTPYGLSKK